MEHFTKEEAVSLLGETVVCKKAFVQEYPGVDQILVLFDEGEKANVVFVGKQSDVEGIFIALLVDDAYLEFHKDAFERHCALLNSNGEGSYASAC